MIWVSTRRATFGLVVKGDTILEGAPYGMKVLKRQGIATAVVAIDYFVELGADVRVLIDGNWTVLDRHLF